VTLTKCSRNSRIVATEWVDFSTGRTPSCGSTLKQPFSARIALDCYPVTFSPKMKLASPPLVVVGLIGCLLRPEISSAENPSSSPTPSLEQRVSELEQKIQAIENIPVVALALKLRGSAEQNTTATPTPSPQADSPLELVSWEYKFKAGQYSYENRHLFTYVLKNLSDKPIKLVDGTLLFTDLLGEKLIAIKLDRDAKYPAGKITSTSGAWNVNTFGSSESRMTTISHDDVKATLLIRNVVFGDNSTWSAKTQQ
jgi:hypothetical protein